MHIQFNGTNICHGLEWRRVNVHGVIQPALCSVMEEMSGMHILKLPSISLLQLLIALTKGIKLRTRILETGSLVDLSEAR
jgi:hypothetical protein